MNVDKQKIALALRMLAEAFDEGESEAAPTPVAPPPPAPRTRRPRTVVAPAGEADEITKARAARALREHGYRRTGT